MQSKRIRDGSRRWLKASGRHPRQERAWKANKRR
jgi:hypothetical protein